MGIKQRLGDKYWNFCSVKSNEKLLVIESDDWGSLRTESQNIRKRLNETSVNYNKDPYIQYDGLANSEDLQAMFEMFSKIKSEEGLSPLLTANFCMSNPDFDKIRAKNYQEFFFERFDQSILKNKEGSKVLKLWTEGISKGLIKPQLHGREHVHALAWLSELRQGNKDLLKAFELSVWGIPYQAIGSQRRVNLQAALDVYNMKGEEDFQVNWIIEASQIFKDYFGFRSKTFIAPAYTWSENVHGILADVGIESLQGIKLQYDPIGTSYKKRLRFLGETCKLSGLMFYPRNVFFEPSLYPNKDWYSETLVGIKKAFDHKQPAIIGSHRINYIGKLDEKNRTKNLKTLKQILTKVVELYPEVHFISSDALHQSLCPK